jgi:hypothetical protein
VLGFMLSHGRLFFKKSFFFSQKNFFLPPI